MNRECLIKTSDKNTSQLAILERLKNENIAEQKLAIEMTESHKYTKAIKDEESKHTHHHTEKVYTKKIIIDEDSYTNDLSD